MNFALTPGQATNAMIDYTTAEGTKLYKAATTKLSDDLYNCKAMTLRDMLSTFSDRAMEFGWEMVLDIPQDVANPLGPTDAFWSIMER